MEFGIFLQGHVPSRRVEQDPSFEHFALMREVEIAKAADKAGFKCVWASEHHFLQEYSHLSDSGAFLAFVAGQTENIHVATGIRNLSPKVNNPIRVAEEVAMMDHLSEGRFELGTGRGAGWHEVQGFDIPDTRITKAWWNEVIRELPRMWRSNEYEFAGEFFNVPGKRQILPKPYKHSHPAMWMACGNPASWEIAGQLGLGAIGFSISTIDSMAPRVEAYKKALASAEPIGEWVNDNVMATNIAICLEDGDLARKVMADSGTVRLHAGVSRYHSTMPPMKGVPAWPEVLADPTIEMIELGIEHGYMACGTPDEVVEQLKRFEATGIDQITFSLPVDIPQEHCLETIRLLGHHVNPKYDKDPVHRTTRMREAADVPSWASQVVAKTVGPYPEPDGRGVTPA